MYAKEEEGFSAPVIQNFGDYLSNMEKSNEKASQK